MGDVYGKDTRVIRGDQEGRHLLAIQLQHAYFGAGCVEYFILTKGCLNGLSLVLLRDAGRQGRTFNEGRVGYHWSWGEDSLFI